MIEEKREDGGKRRRKTRDLREAVTTGQDISRENQEIMMIEETGNEQI